MQSKNDSENLDHLILSELRKQSDRLSVIEKAMQMMVRQDEKILNLQSETHILWKKYDDAFNLKDGTVTKIQNFQQSCPRESMKRQIIAQWSAIVLLASLVVTIGAQVFKG